MNSLEKNGCPCHAHTQHAVFWYMWHNPSAKQSNVAKVLHTTVGNVKVAMYHLRRKPDLSRTCVECFSNQLFDGVCHVCGFEPASPVIPLEMRFDEQSPTNSLQAGSELGSTLNFKAKGLSDNNGRFTNNGKIVKRWIEHALEDPLTMSVKSDVMNELKRYYPAEVITDFAGKLCIKEVVEFRANYPMLAGSKKVRKQLATRVMKRLQFVYPSLAPHTTAGG